MLTLRLILRQVCRFCRNLTERAAKRLYRSSAVFMAGAALITVIAFTSAGFGSEGSNALTAFAKTPAPDAAEAAGEESVTKAEVQVPEEEKIQGKDGQIFVGERHYKQLIMDTGIQALRIGETAGQKQAVAVSPEETVNQTEAKELEETRAEDLLEEDETALTPGTRPSGEEPADQPAADETQPADPPGVAQQANAAGSSIGIPLSNDDYQVLLKIVQAEAGICDEEGRILVANVIINRVRSSRFPNSVRSVVYAPSQFSPVSNGSINSVKVTDTTRQCVNRALQGEDYSQGALYFMNRGGARGKAVSWFDSHLTYLFSHDGHEFFK